VDVDGPAGVLRRGFGLILEPSGLVSYDRRAAPVVTRIIVWVVFAIAVGLPHFQSGTGDGGAVVSARVHVSGDIVAVQRVGDCLGYGTHLLLHGHVRLKEGAFNIGWG